jgi:hypothetical protein
VDLEGVKHTIELLEILKQKTAGNLTEPESRLLEEILFDLRRDPGRGASLILLLILESISEIKSFTNVFNSPKV